MVSESKSTGTFGVRRPGLEHVVTDRADRPPAADPSSELVDAHGKAETGKFRSVRSDFSSDTMKKGGVDVLDQGGAGDAAKASHVREQVVSAMLYVMVSILITFANKVVLSSYQLRSFVFLSFCQSFTAVLTIPIICRMFHLDLPTSLRGTLRKLMPLPVIFLLNAVFSLGGTERLSIPMMTVLRRFSIPLTMIFEFWLLKTKSSLAVSCTVLMMIVGAVIAAADDLVFSASGYAFVLISDIFTALNGVYNKKKLDECREIGMHGMLLVNNMFNLPIMGIVCVLLGDFDKVFHDFDRWSDPGFLVWFALATGLGVCLNFTVLYCTNANSALTTSVIGCLKNLVVTYCGMVLVPGYVYTTKNFIGINISVLGSIIYSVVRHLETRCSQE